MDGAHLGVGPDRALRTILGGEPQPTSEERMDDAAFERYILDAPEKPDTYEDCARLIAKLALAVIREHPFVIWTEVPTEDEYTMPADGEFSERWEQRVITREGFDAVWKRLNPTSYQQAMDTHPTGFQWGWAVNAARKCSNLPPGGNPAFL